jgi:hypothetical protein
MIALRSLAAALCALVISSQSAGAQIEQRRQVESRLDVLVSRWTAAQGAIGVTVPAGSYVRAGMAAGVGGGARGVDSRIDLFSRFTFDPFRQSRWSPYGGGGLSGRYVARDSPRAHAYMLVFVGFEGPLSGIRASGWVPALELGLGGGARFGVVLRQGIRGRR